jgi:hypothetical protein
MLDLVGLLMAPRVYLGALIGVLAGFGAAFLVRWIFGSQVPIELLALLVAVGAVVGIAVGAWHRANEP